MYATIAVIEEAFDVDNLPYKVGQEVPVRS